MINLRYHIVSIVAVFLALAIGILTGSTLLDRATVDVLKGSQRRLDATNANLKDANEELRNAIENGDPSDASFGNDVLPNLLPGLLDDGPVLILATRGINEDVVRAVQTSVRDAGGSPLGIVWFDARFDLDNPDSASDIAAALGIAEEDDALLKTAIIADLAAGLDSSASSESSVVVTSTTTSTTTTPPDGSDDGTTIPDETTTPAGSGDATDDEDDPALDVFNVLVDAELIDWDSPNEGEQGARTLPPEGLDIVLLSGEGSELRPGRLMHPLARALAERRSGVVVGEVHNPRTGLETVDDDEAPRRGAFVDALRSDDAVAERTITIDNVDQPFGRLAVVLALSGLPNVTSGAYGVAPSAAQPFPTASG